MHHQYTTYTKKDAKLQLSYFDVLLTVHLSTFISVLNQLDAQIFFVLK